MKKLVCDLCGKELDVRACYDEDGYSQYVNVEIRNSRKPEWGAEPNKKYYVLTILQNLVVGG